MEKHPPFPFRMTATQRISVVACIGLLTVPVANAQTVTPDFAAIGYSLADLGSIPGVPVSYGGLTIRPGVPDTLYIGGSANSVNAAIYAVPLLRDAATRSVTGFGGPVILHASAPNIDGGLVFAPNGTILFTRFSANEVGQILPDGTYSSTPLSGLGVASSVGSLAFVPSGYPGAGNLILSSYSSSMMYHVPFSVDASGLYTLAPQAAQVAVASTASGPEGIAYIPPGSQGFPALSMALSSYNDGKVVVYEVGAHGLPDVTTARDMVVDLTGAEGALIDPVTGDYLFSTFSGTTSKVVRISGFKIPTSIGADPSVGAGPVSVFPNPSDGLFRLGFPHDAAGGSVEVFGTRGETVLRGTLTGGTTHTIDLSGQPPGVYQVRVVRTGSVWRGRLVVR